MLALQVKPLDSASALTWIRFNPRPEKGSVPFAFLLPPLDRPAAMSRPFYLQWPYCLVCSQPSYIWTSFLPNVLFVLISVVLWFISSIAKVFNKSNAFHWIQCFDQIPHYFWKIFICRVCVTRLTLWHCDIALSDIICCSSDCCSSDSQDLPFHNPLA